MEDEIVKQWINSIDFKKLASECKSDLDFENLKKCNIDAGPNDYAMVVNVRGKRSKIFDVVTEDGQIRHIDLNDEE